MPRYLIFALLSLPMHIYAFDQWLCTSQHSKLIGASFYACGSAQTASEEATSLRSFMNAEIEFNSFCSQSSKCMENRREVTIEPGRMECEKVLFNNSFITDEYKCYRLIIYHLPE